MDFLIELASVPLALIVFLWALVLGVKRCERGMRQFVVSQQAISRQLEPVRVTDPRLGRLGCPCGVPCPPIKDQEVKSL